MTTARASAGLVAGRRAAARREEKYDERRVQLAESALLTLGQLGYGRTSLREIAANSEFSHGVVHYYFASKIELIIFCVRHYKTTCVRRYDGLLDECSTAEQLCERFSAQLAATMVEDAPMHRLWFDLRTQSMFESELKADVLDIDRTLEVMIWNVVSRYAELAGREPVFDSATSYAMLDGVFEKALLAHLAGDDRAAAVLTARTSQVLPALLA